MNERIRELAIQAKAESNQWLGSKPAITITYDELEKFAELIVRKCIEICRSEDWEDQQGWGKFYAHQIKKHFEAK